MSQLSEDAWVVAARTLDELRAERDFLSAEQVRLIGEREAVRAQLAALAAHLAEVKLERDANLKRAAMFERMYDEARGKPCTTCGGCRVLVYPDRYGPGRKPCPSCCPVT